MAILGFDYHDAITQHITMCIQQILICRYNHVCLRGVFAYENINVMTFTWVFACAWTLGGVTSFARVTLFKLYLRVIWCDFLRAYVPCLHCFGAYGGHISVPCIVMISCTSACVNKPCLTALVRRVSVICFAVSRFWLRVLGLP